MRSYTNKKGEKITVSEEHLNIAVNIKIELQKASPSMRCSWNNLVKMMKEEGFDDAENSENYRCMIKNYQKSIDKLPSVESYADMVSDIKIDSIKKMVGELAYKKRDAQNQFRELNKVKRDVIDKSLFIEEVVSGLKDIDFSEFNFGEAIVNNSSENSITVTMTDWHVGLKTKNYNYEIAKKRVKEYSEKIIHYCNLFDVSTVHVLGIGDLVEGGYMRPTQAYDIEFTYSEQVVKATEIINYFLLLLSKELNVVYLGSVLGNHSRMYDKGVTISGDSAENIVDASVKSFIKMIGNSRIVVMDKKVDNFEIVYKTNGRTIKAVHGDLLSKKSEDKIAKHISSDNVMYDVLIYGHFHHASYKEENNDRHTIGGGCLQGSTDYSAKLGYNTVPSQTIIVFEKNNILPIRIPLIVDYK